MAGRAIPPHWRLCNRLGPDNQTLGKVKSGSLGNHPCFRSFELNQCPKYGLRVRSFCKPGFPVDSNRYRRRGSHSPFLSLFF